MLFVSPSAFILIKIKTIFYPIAVAFTREHVRNSVHRYSVYSLLTPW